MNIGDTVRFIGWNDDEIDTDDPEPTDPVPGDVGVIVDRYSGREIAYPLGVRFFRNPHTTTSLAPEELEVVK